MPAPGASKNHGVETPVVAGARRSSSLKTPVVPSTRRSSSLKTPVVPNTRRSSSLKTPVVPNTRRSSSLKTPVVPNTRRSSSLKTPVVPNTRRSSSLKTPVVPNTRRSSSLKTPVVPNTRRSSSLKTPVVPNTRRSSSLKTPVVPNTRRSSSLKTPVVPNTRRSSSLKAPVVLNTRRSSRLKAFVVPNTRRSSRRKVLAATEVLYPPDFVCIQALPVFAQMAEKVLARNRTIYRSSEPPRDQVFWENYHRRQKQITQGHFSPNWEPYQELREVLYKDLKKLTLYALGRLAQEPVKKDVQEKTPKEVAEVTTNKNSFSPESDPPKPVKERSRIRETGKELRTLSAALARSRHHMNSVKRGGEYFHILHQEALERKNTLEAAQQAQGPRWRTEFEPPKFSSDSEEEINTCSLRKSGKKKTITLHSFAPVYTSVLIPSLPGAKSEHLFRQLCAIHWLLEALTRESNSSMRSIFTCWNPTDPGGCKKTAKEIEEEKSAKYMWELCITNTKKYNWKSRINVLSRKINKTCIPGLIQLSRQSSPCSQITAGSERSSVSCSEDNIKINVASSDVMSESAQAKEQQTLFPSLQKVNLVTREEGSKDVHKQDDLVKKTGVQRLLPVAQKNYGVKMPFIKDQESLISRKQRPGRQSCHISTFIKSKSNLGADMKQKFTAVREEAAYCLHDTLEHLERRQEERCRQKYHALKQLTYFRRDMERIRQLGMRARRERDEDRLNWFPVLLARLPESVKSDRNVQKILKKLEKYGKIPDLKIHPDTFLKALADLQVWELCSPEIAAAVEFVRENIVQMPEEDFSEWLQARVDPRSAQSSTS
ncbi:PREDICTED: coiled-coil domain-containing protein 60 [Calidris pugnax]|uniref:coiled-coil domain-containing protein 60 n=1 Tax=Calidris pugnax TaxID=198806 RepID=UPI00071D2F6B|nr:PREDICTED: coiled-coil domain-containing protein 60 [Calidris pugnax]XP_014817060.1 PREDICTED: coiled-coil domain-containing protein 60 [Calidris pugnax]